MQALLAPLKELAEFEQMKEAIRKNKGPVSVTGCVDSQKLHMIYGLSDGIKCKVIVTYSDIKAAIFELRICSLCDIIVEKALKTSLLAKCQ